MYATPLLGRTLFCLALVGGFSAASLAVTPDASVPAVSATAVPAPDKSSVLFYDDFNGRSLNSLNWVAGEHQWGSGASNNNGVIPQNLLVGRVVDPSTGAPITVLDAQAHGDQYTGPVPGIRKVASGFSLADPRAYASPGTYGNGYQRTGAVVWTRLRFGPAKYEIRMRALQHGGGETAIWNYYDPPTQSPGSGAYSEIDVEIPANGSNGNMAVAGLNTYATRAGSDPQQDATTDCNCLPTDIGNQADGKFHLYEIDWYDGSDGTKPRVVWYVDGKLVQTSTRVIPRSPAQLWVGNWPAVWSHNGSWDYASQDQYIDYVKISKLDGNSYPDTPPPAPEKLTVVTASSTTVDLAWQNASDSNSTAGYNVLLNGVLIERTMDTHIELQGLAPGSSFSFAVQAVNTAMVASEASNVVRVSLPRVAPACGAIPMFALTRLTAKPVSKEGTRGVRLGWDTPAYSKGDAVVGGAGCSILGYTIADSSSGTIVQPGGGAHGYTAKGVTPGEYRYDVSPYNQFGTGPSVSVTVTVP